MTADARRQAADDNDDATATAEHPPRLTLNAAVRRRRADQAFFIRIGRAIQQNERALERLSR